MISNILSGNPLSFASVDAVADFIEKWERLAVFESVLRSETGPVTMHGTTIDPELEIEKREMRRKKKKKSFNSSCNLKDLLEWWLIFRRCSSGHVLESVRVGVHAASSVNKIIPPCRNKED